MGWLIRRPAALCGSGSACQSAVHGAGGAAARAAAAATVAAAGTKGNGRQQHARTRSPAWMPRLWLVNREDKLRPDICRQGQAAKGWGHMPVRTD